MNKNILVLGILLISLLSGCLEQKSEINTENSSVQITNSTKIIYTEELEVQIGKRSWVDKFYRFEYKNETCYVSKSGMSSADGISCFKNN